MDYYIASPETEHGYGQNYEYWLNMLGETPGVNGCELGKKIVDDFYDFYEPGYSDGSRQEGTLSVIDIKKLLDSDFLYLMTKVVEMMRTQALTDRQFYDEIRSYETSIEYGDGEVDVVDATLIQRYDAMLIDFWDYQLKLADVDGDGEVTIIDATWIQRYDIKMKAPEGIGVTLVE